MSEAMSEALSAAKEHAPSLPSPADVRDAVQSHLPSVDLDSVRSMARKKASGKRSGIAWVVGALAAAAALMSLIRHRR
ncbi:MAG TPA: hypothetical protein VHE57_07650, partial [Mycobacteriales bacterium]|nr:hypothetical protein [Mycobacteriales bacterium]